MENIVILFFLDSIGHDLSTLCINNETIGWSESGIFGFNNVMANLARGDCSYDDILMHKKYSEFIVCRV